MSSQSPGGAKSNSDQISTDDDEDKKFVSQAVTFMIGHARNGFVSLCASVASLLKEQARLKQEVEYLQQETLTSKKQSLEHNIEVEYLQQETLTSKNQSLEHNIEVEVQTEVNKKRESLNSDSTASDHKSTQHIPESASLIKLSKQLPYKKIKGCICNMCLMNNHESPLTAPLEKGMKVIIRGELCGTVEYVGHVEALDFPEIQVGVSLTEAIGNSDGRVCSKVYFSAPKNYGMFIPLSHVLCVVK